MYDGLVGEYGTMYLQVDFDLCLFGVTDLAY